MSLSGKVVRGPTIVHTISVFNNFNKGYSFLMTSSRKILSVKSYFDISVPVPYVEKNVIKLYNYVVSVHRKQYKKTLVSNDVVNQLFRQTSYAKHGLLKGSWGNLSHPY